MKFAIALYIVLIIALVAFTAHAGTPVPNKCLVPGHEGPKCDMTSCKAIGPKGEPNGSICSKNCAKECCSCSDKCPRDYRPNQDEEILRMAFGD